jgi:gamma-glutamyltranspeptidase/glutathione hydrolase
MVSTQHYLATRAGTKMLEQGGNAVDAAVAAAFALSVCEPAASGLGGQTMALIHLAASRRTLALDGSSRTPNRTSAQALSKQDRLRGYKATTVPSTAAVLGYALRRYGTKTLAQVTESAICLAEQGYQITDLQHMLLAKVKNYLRNGPAGTLFLKNGQHAYRAGERSIRAESL